jgi:hypothetical protein
VRLDNVNFAALNAAEAQEPRFVIEIAFDSPATDFWYFLSHADCLVPAGVTTNKTVGIENLKIASQSIDPIKSIFTIGTMSFDVVDNDEEVSDLLKTKFDAAATTSNKRAVAYIGDAELTTFDDYIPAQTQLLAQFKTDGAKYSWTCRDIQRQANQKIFEPYVTNLRASVSATSATIPVFDAVDYTILHDSSYGDAPSATVGYIRIDDEIIRYTGVDTTPGSNTYTGCTRGVLNTRAAQHDIDSDGNTDNDRQPEVSEVIYFEGPAPKIALKLLTGSYSGETFPDHWSLGIDSAFVASSLFTGIGDDWWNTSTDEGVPVREVMPKPQDGKKYIEKEIMLAIGAFMPIGSDGQIGLKRMTGVLSSASGVVELNETNIVSYSNLTFDEPNIYNQFLIDWNWDPVAEKFTRRNVLIDSTSISKFKAGKSSSLKFTAIHGSKTTKEILYGQLDSVRNRYAGYPKLINVELLPEFNRLEVGDVPRVRLDNVPDHTSPTGLLDSAFEIQSMSVDWITGTVNARLFGSSDSMTPSTLIGKEDVQPDSWYQTLGTDLEAYCDGLSGRPLMNGTGNITVGGHISGAALIENGMYYRIGDVTVDSGVTVTIDDNVLIAAAGFFQLDGDIDGIGAGIPGASAISGDLNGTSGTPGYLGDTQSDGGINAVSVILAGASDIQLTSSAPVPTSGVNSSAIPPLSLNWDSGALIGLTGDYRGTSGGGGGSIVDDDPVADPVATGGTGGNGGAALVIISQGFAAGISGGIDLSGDPGNAGATGTITSTGSANHIATAGSGASGCPGGLYLITDGSLQTVGTMQHTSLRPAASVVANAARMSKRTELASRTDSGDYVRSYDKAFGALEFGNAAFIHQYLPSDDAPQEDVPENAEDPLSLSLVEVVPSEYNAGVLVNIEATVTPPTSDGNYDHSNLYYRALGAVAWVLFGASPESSFSVAADGTTYEVQARSVSISGTENPSGPIEQITTSVIEPIDVVNAPTNLAAVSGTDQLVINNAGVVISRIKLTWTGSTTSTVNRYEIQIKKTTDSVWDSAATVGDVSQTVQFISDVEDGVTYDVRVRAGNTYDFFSTWLATTHTVTGKTELPGDVPWFSISGNTLTWGEVTDLDLAGYVIRYQHGDNVSYGDAAPLHDGFITAQTYISDALPSGATTLMIKAVDTTGNLSETSAIIKANLGDPIVANIVETFDQHALGFPGTITNGTVDGISGDLEADTQAALMWSDDSKDMWMPNAGDLMWATVQYAPMTYEVSISPSLAQDGSVMTIAETITGLPWQLLYRRSGPSAMWSADDSTPMWSDDSYLMWLNAPEYQPWPGSVVALNEQFDFKITTGQGNVQGIVSEFAINIDVPSIIESLNDVAISALGTRLPITKTYNSITNVALTLQDDGGTAISAKVFDKDADLGPLVKTLNSSGTAVSGTIDATIQGF